MTEKDDDEPRGLGIMGDFPGQWSRLLQACNAKNDMALAKALDIAQGSVSKAKGKESIPPVWFVRVASEFGISLDWLVFGIGHMVRGNHDGGTDSCQDIALIPLVRARLSAGGGSFETGGDVEGHYAFRRQWLARKGQASKMVLMRVSGDSMEPDIKDGDMVLLDQSQRDVLAGEIFAVGLGEVVVVKMLDVAPGKIVLRSINPLYPPMGVDMTSDLADSVRIIGRVIWWCREAR